MIRVFNFLVIYLLLVFSEKKRHGHKRSHSKEWTKYCSSSEILFQYKNIYQGVDPSICDDQNNAWKLVQLNIPQAKVFLDIGANLGYVSAMIFGIQL